MSQERPKIAIIGAGIIGLSCAWELLRRGARVTIYDKQWPPKGASWAAAGMLAPAFEGASREDAHPHLFDLCRLGADLWPNFAAELEEASGMAVGYRSGPTLAVALDEAETENLLNLEETLLGAGMPVKRLYRRELDELERSVSPDFETALALLSDGRVDPRQTLLALRLAIERVGGEFEFVPAGVTEADLASEFDICLDASGARRHGPVTPVKGVMLAFRRADMPLDHVVRCGAEYAVPRGDRVLVGATVGEVADPRSYLLSQAVRFLPRIRSAALMDQWSGWRPATADHAPLLGRTEQSGVYVANGHYRNGILLAPVTAQIMAEMILGGETSELAKRFAPSRFGATA